MKAIIAGKEYIIKQSDWTPQSGPTDPGITQAWTIYADIFDQIGYGVLISLGVNFGYRLTLRDNRGKIQWQEFTRDQVELIPDP